MSSDRIERRFFIVKLQPIMAASRADCSNLRDRRGVIVGESFRLLRQEAIWPPIRDAAKIGKRDSRIFLQDPIRCDS
jgi:hypothetical protein